MKGDISNDKKGVTFLK